MIIKSYRERIFILIILIAFICFLLICRLFYLQFILSNKMRAKAENEIVKIIQVELARGTIFDRNLKELAISIEVDSVYAQPKEIQAPYTTAIKLAHILNINPKTVYAKLTSKASFVWIKRKITTAQSQKISVLNIKGIGFLKEYKRFYPKNELAAQVIGFAGLDNKGLEGIELTHDRDLRGGVNKLEVVQDGKGNTILSPKSNYITRASNGNDIILTIDEIIQHHAEIELKKTCSQYQAKGGVIIVMDPKTGEILASAVSPSCDPNYFNKYPSGQFKNRIITDVFEPGSTFKIITAATLLKEKSIDPDKMYFCSGEIQVGNHVVHCHNPHGSLNLEGIIANSCNVGVVQCIQKLNERKFYSQILEFGLNEPTGIDLRGEEKGLLPNIKAWSKLSKPNIAIGQGVSVTPLQLITAVAAIANNGILMKPLIIKAIRNPKGEIIKKFKPCPIRQVISSELANKITQILKKVVTDGTGKLAQINGYEIAGKTGTAQKVDSQTGGYSEDKFIASFVGYLPADDPKLIILVVIDEPKGTYWGSQVAVPAFKQIAKRVLSYRGILPTKEQVNDILL